VKSALARYASAANPAAAAAHAIAVRPATAKPREPLPMLGAALPFFIIHAIINTIINIQYSNK
jgi:hypothetical protein